jgi:flagellar protein FlaG
MSNEVNIAKDLQSKISGSSMEVSTFVETKSNNRIVPVPVKKVDPASQTLLKTDDIKHIDDQNVKLAVSELNKHMQEYRREIQFSVDDDTGRTVIKVFDQETKKLIRQIPAEEVLEIAKNLIEDKEGKGKLLEVSV